MGFAIVELLLSCPINWKLDPHQALNFIEEQMVPIFPPGDHRVHPEISQIKV